MGWSATFKSNKEITIDEMREIVGGLPANLKRSYFGLDFAVAENDWGWSAATDIHVPVENKFCISGSYGMSGDKAESMAEFLKGKLEERGHVIEVNFNW